MRLFWRKKVTDFDRLLKKVAANNFDPSLSQVDLRGLGYRGGRIGEDDAKRIAEALRGNTVVTELWLWNNNTGDEGARALADMIENNSSITRLDLGGNSIGDVGARKLAEAIRENFTIARLNLTDNLIGAAGATALAEALEVNSSVSELNLGRNIIGAAGARALAEMLRNNASVTFLGLTDCGIGDAGASELSEALEANSSVSELYLEDNGIGDEGATALAEALRHNSSVRTLFLNRNNIGDAGVRELVEMLQVNSSVTKICVWRDNFVYTVYGDQHQQRLEVLTKINRHAPTPEEARRLKIVCKVEWWLADSKVDAETAAAVELVLDQLGSFPKADERRELFGQLLGLPEHGADVAASVDVATARTLYRYAADCGAAPLALMNLMRAHPSLCICRDVEHKLYPFMLLATMVEAGVGGVLELLLLNPNLVESGINQLD